MGYVILIIIFVFIISWIERRTFRWETVIKYLWKQIYQKADQMASHMKQFDINNVDEISLKGFKSQIEIRGRLINTILDYVNNLRKESDDNSEEETFGYGRYSLDTVLYFVNTSPQSFKKLIK